MTNTSLRVIQVVNVRWFNATAWYALFLSRLLQDAGHSVRVLGLPGTDSFKKAESWGLSPLPLALNEKNPLRFPSLYSAVAGHIRDFSPHLVNCHRGEGFLFWTLARKQLRGSRPFALVRTRGDQRPPKANLPNTLLHRDADALIATNSRTARAFIDDLGVAPERVHTIFGGVDTARFSPDPEGRERMRAAWGVAPGETIFGLLGRFDPVKGQKESIEAIARLRQKGFHSIRLVLAGFDSCSSTEEVTAWIREQSLEEQVTLTGKLSDVRAAVCGFDCGLLASTGSEAIARAALEIMACAVPLIGTTVGVMPDLLRAEDLVPPADAAALATLMERFLTDHDYGQSLRASQAERMQQLGGRNFLEQSLAAYAAAMETASRAGRNAV